MLCIVIYFIYYKSVFSLINLAVNTTVPTFGAKSCDAVPLLLGSSARCS